ncbi:MAG: DNA mismatch repair endonuclease MutL [Clostridia bacterium]|nr:DNA mismatch repair endonuclease MutL [Clostridia bacterium]
MAKIHVLDPLISNKIAAGEVVEKPASVIKELVENAIDAGSKNITIEIKGGGKDYIRVSDDGHGIEPDDLLTAFLRHATSKISRIEDIYNIQSLGFRGEALASIASVSNIELISKVADKELGEKLVLSGGKVLSQDAVGASNGTTIIMKDLFFNTPARLKFLKSDGAEQNAISAIVNKLALSHTDISFKYIINERIIFKTQGNNDLKDAVYAIFGKEVSQNLIAFEHEGTDQFKITGLLSAIHFTRGNRQLQIVFVNGRYIASKIVSESLELAYKGLVPLHRHPVCFLFIELDAKTIDVNIHPSKTEIKFHEENSIKQTLYTAIRKCINSYNQVPTETFKKIDVFSKPEASLQEKAEVSIREEKPSPKTMPTQVEKITATSSSSTRQSINTHYPTPTKSAMDVLYQSQEERDEPSIEPIAEQKTEQRFEKTSAIKSASKPSFISHTASKELGTQYNLNDLLVKETIEKSDDTPDYLPVGKSIYDDLIYVGQAFESFLILQKEAQLYFIDQHAAHEKILYESFREKYKKRQMEAQMLLDPITISMTYNEQELLLSNVTLLQNIGFEVEAFGMNDIIIRSVPVLFDRPAGKHFIEQLIEHIEGPEDLATLQDEEIIMQSCKAAIKANHRVHHLEVEQMLKDLRNLDDPYTCPHGRPIIIAMHQYEIERKFKRT